MPDLAIDDLLRNEGFGSTHARAAAREVLEAAGLTRPGKQRIAAEKLNRARDALNAAIVAHCSKPECMAAVAHDARRSVEVEPAHCSICTGSNNRRALRRMAHACAAAGVHRLLIVGGAPTRVCRAGAHPGRRAAGASFRRRHAAPAQPQRRAAGLCLGRSARGLGADPAAAQGEPAVSAGGVQCRAPGDGAPAWSRGTGRRSGDAPLA